MLDHTERIRSVEFDFPLPEERVAQRPRAYQDQKLIVFNCDSQQIRHTMFNDLASILKPGDLIVANDSKVVPAALRRDDGLFILIMQPEQQSLSNVKAICPSKPAVGDVIEFDRVRYVVKEHESGWDVYHGDLLSDQDYASLADLLEDNGSTPLPIYIDRPPDLADESDFQTVFARYPGSIACPTAGLHFSPELIENLARNDIETVTLTLHVGYGTFRRFKSEFVDEHVADSENYRVPLAAVRRIGQALKEGRRIIAVGTTTTRTLESIPEQLAHYEDIESDIVGETSLFIYPPFEFKVLSGLITNLAYPRISVMSLAAAFTGLEQLKELYRQALAHDYFFYTYGDALLALKTS
jgi:S-adenosylmethionine:tRNA ribosyltransferase-isomerase